MMLEPLGGGKVKNRTAAIEKTLIAPVGGLNSRDPLGAMKPGDALILDNFICRPTCVEIRKGVADFVTGFDPQEKIWSLMPYRAAPNDRLFAATDKGIYEVTTAGVVGAAKVPCTNGRWESVQGSNAGISYLLAVNGTDPMKFFNGTAWADAAITGISSSTRFTSITQFKFRVFLTEKGTLSFWYLDVNAVQGTAHEFPLAPLFVKGGYLMACGSWTVDGGNGSDDYAAFITSEGELAIYKGTDPSNATNWGLVGVYTLPRPLGRKCLMKFGGDVLVITEGGVVPLSKMLQAVSLDKTTSISDKVVGAISDAAATYKANFGWSLTAFPTESILLLNVPVVEGRRSEQFVMSTLSGAWSKFKGIDALCFAEMGGRLFYGLQGKVAQALTTQADFGANITSTAKTAFHYFGSQMKRKHVKLLRPNFTISKKTAINFTISPDFQAEDYIGQTSTSSNGLALFDVSRWDQAVWAGSTFTDDRWRTVVQRPGYCLALLIQINSKDVSFQWNSTDFLLAVGTPF